jgi:hypothetical protein
VFLKAIGNTLEGRAVCGDYLELVKALSGGGE